MSDIRFRMAAKTDVGLERTNNEDNFQASANLEEAPMRWVNNQEYSLGRKGALLVVADGMGGMNAGEVASEIAINTVRELFAPEQITDEVVKTRYTIEKFMKGVVVEADRRIKEFAKDNPDSRGMGTTIVIAWLFDGQLYVSWCGDSRAYIYNETTGLFQISKDHSYVQQLVDAGKISKEDAFDFPDSNIITRSLSDASPKANPDCLLIPQPLCNGDIILLCSDGLNGMIRDEEIEAVMAQNRDNMTNCVDSLIHAALEAAGADNCTVAVCQILSGGSTSSSDRIPKYSTTSTTKEANSQATKRPKKTGVWIALVSLLCAIACVLTLYFTKTFPFNPKEEKEKEIATDTVTTKPTSPEPSETEATNEQDATTDEAQDANEQPANQESTEAPGVQKKPQRSNKDKGKASATDDGKKNVIGNDKGKGGTEATNEDGENYPELTPISQESAQDKPGYHYEKVDHVPNSGTSNKNPHSAKTQTPKQP